MVQGTAWDIEDVCERVLNKWTSSLKFLFLEEKDMAG